MVEPPAERPNTDPLYLVSGEVLHGSYLGGDANGIRFAVGNEVHQIPSTEVASLQPQPPIDS